MGKKNKIVSDVATLTQTNEPSLFVIIYNMQEICHIFVIIATYFSGIKKPGFGETDKNIIILPP